LRLTTFLQPNVFVSVNRDVYANINAKECDENERRRACSHLNSQHVHSIYITNLFGHDCLSKNTSSINRDKVNTLIQCIETCDMTVSEHETNNLGTLASYVAYTVASYVAYTSY